MISRELAGLIQIVKVFRNLERERFTQKYHLIRFFVLIKLSSSVPNNFTMPIVFENDLFSFCLKTSPIRDK